MFRRKSSTVAMLPAMLATMLAGAAGPAWAQRANENAVANADDAFGSSVGLEQTGIYSESDTRGFSPAKAGNARIDGLYYDPVGALSSRLRHTNVVRVGFASEDYPFHAPTGIIDYRFKPFPTEIGTSFGYNAMAYGGVIEEWDLRLVTDDRKLAFLGGFAHSNLMQSDGVRNEAFGVTGRVMARLGDFEIAPFYSHSVFTTSYNHPLVIDTGDALPAYPVKRRYLGQDWAKGHYVNHQMGVTARATVTDRLSLRGGLFRAIGDRQKNFSELFAYNPATGTASHRLIADPAHDIRSTSGEAQAAYRFATGAWQHRILAGFRARERVTETGGSDVRDFGTVVFGELDPEIEPAFTFGTPNHGIVRHSSFLLGYTGKMAGFGTLNLGVQKAKYRATARDGRTGLVTTTRDGPWLYNATLGIDLTPAFSVYFGSERGLEDSGVAPENAVNRNQQLPATRATQYEAGLRWKFAGGQMVVSAFEITKPYFSFDAAGVFAPVGEVRHRGVETSLSGHFGKRLNLLAGAVLMQPRVSGAARDQGLIGERPTGTPSVYARLDLNYRTDIFGGLTPTASLIHTGARAAGSRPQASLGGKQLMVPSWTTLDLGLRQQFKVGKVPASFRFVVLNVFDAKTWKVAGPNTIYMDERRRLNLTVTADF